MIEECFPCQDAHGMLGCGSVVHNVRCAASKRHRAEDLVAKLAAIG